LKSETLMIEGKSKIYSSFATLFLLTSWRISAASESSDDKERKRIFFHSSVIFRSEKESPFIDRQEKTSLAVSGGEKCAMRGSTSAINRSHNCKCISVLLVLRISNVLLILCGTVLKWCYALANWGYYGCCWFWHSFLMARQRWERSARPQPVSDIPRIWTRRLQVMEVCITTVILFVRSDKNNKKPN